MKASTAAIILRAMRARAESNSLVSQIGKHEIFALQLAKQKLPTEQHKVVDAIITLGMVLGNVQLLPPLIDAVRDGYKGLETLGDQEFDVAATEKGLTTDPKVNVKLSDPDWIKNALGSINLDIPKVDGTEDENKSEGGAAPKG